ncbi:hypothetical protein [uncultured Streptomyces sp.]|uniref:hypothetical protein n=1 Tax=uncultured Streptomyces sp. TaxID=174707 RepID=UPI00262CBD36|nr:hypothetical protein [uncultured Streptomyces sp.]
MPRNRPVARRTDALTRASVRRSATRAPAGAIAEEEAAPGRLRWLKSPAAWLLTIVLTVAAVTFQDVLTASVKTILPLDRVPDRLSPQGAIEVVEVKNVKYFGYYLVRGGADAEFRRSLPLTEEWREDPRTVDVETSEWVITLQGRASQQVRITDIVPEIEGGSCKAALTGDSLVHAPSAGAQDVIPLQLKVDSPQPRLEVVGENGKGGEDAEPYFTGSGAKHITLNQNESEAFLVQATAEKGYCRWRYRVHYQVGGGVAETTISAPKGKPFELTARLPDSAGYDEVFFPPTDCASPGKEDLPEAWFEQTGAEYARDRKDPSPPCPES